MPVADGFHWPRQDSQLVKTGLTQFMLAMLASLIVLLASGEQLLVISHLVVALSGLLLVLLGVLRPWLSVSEPWLVIITSLLVCGAFAQWGASLWVVWSSNGTAPAQEIRESMRNISLFTSLLITAGVGVTLLGLRLQVAR